ncbi:MAG TPA: V-type ATP synthase subunit F [Candidatus Nanoarchaeia archaeon]|nr:V-type ATP synthase subunit F [Candidatus Nanoarchaeia archaeon]
MKQIACLGSEAFILGFQMAGIKAITYDKNRVYDQLVSLKDDPNMGIVIVEEALLAQLEGDKQADIMDCVSPVFFPLSAEESFGNIRELIIKSIGVDLMKGE